MGLEAIGGDFPAVRHTDAPAGATVATGSAEIESERVGRGLRAWRRGSLGGVAGAAGTAAAADAHGEDTVGEIPQSDDLAGLGGQAKLIGDADISRRRTGAAGAPDSKGEVIAAIGAGNRISYDILGIAAAAADGLGKDADGVLLVGSDAAGVGDDHVAGNRPRAAGTTDGDGEAILRAVGGDHHDGVDGQAGVSATAAETLGEDAMGAAAVGDDDAAVGHADIARRHARAARAADAHRHAVDLGTGAAGSGHAAGAPAAADGLGEDTDRVFTIGAHAGAAGDIDDPADAAGTTRAADRQRGGRG